MDYLLMPASTLPSVSEKNPAPPLSPCCAKKAKKEELTRYWFKALLTATVGFGLCIFCALGYSIPILALYILAPCCTLIIMYVGWDVFCKAFKEIFYAQAFTMNSLLAVSSLSLLTVSIVSLCMPALGLPLFFDAVLMIFFFFYLGKIIQERAHTIASEINLRDLASKKTEKIKNSNADQKEFDIELEKIETEEVETKTLKVGDYISLKEDDIVPVNGEIIRTFSDATANDNAGTGYFLMPLKQGSDLISGAQISEGAFILKVTATEEDSWLSKLEKKIKEKLKQSNGFVSKKTEVEEFISTKIRYFVPAIMLLALLTGLIVGFLFTPLLGLQIGSSMLIAICPCMLGLIAPLAFSAAQGKAKKNNGLIIKTTRALEIAKEVKTVIFDLNGTLTSGTYSVDKSKSSSDPQILKDFYNVEKESTHKIAKTICTFIKNNHPKAGLGNDILTTYKVGNACQIQKLGMAEAGINEYKKKNGLGEQPGQIIFLLKTHDENKGIIGHMVLTDTLRPEAPRVIQALKSRGIAVKVFTGSDENHALPFIIKLGLTAEDLRANCSGDNEENSKSTYASFFEKNGGVAVVVDQLNDILAIHSDNPGIERLSIAVNSANDRIKALTPVEIKLTQEEISYGKSSLEPILSLFKLSEQFTSHVNQNLALYFTCNLIAVAIPLVLLFAFGIAVNPAWLAGLALVQSVLVLAHVAWFYYKDLPKDVENTLNIVKTQNKRDATEFFPEHSASREILTKWSIDRGYGLLRREASIR